MKRSSMVPCGWRSTLVIRVARQARTYRQRIGISRAPLDAERSQSSYLANDALDHDSDSSPDGPGPRIVAEAANGVPRKGSANEAADSMNVQAKKNGDNLPVGSKWSGPCNDRRRQRAHTHEMMCVPEGFVTLPADLGVRRRVHE